MIFFLDNIGDINGEYSMISMIHVLEHIIDPHKEIEKIAQLLENNGILLIQVPDIHANIF